MSIWCGNCGSFELTALEPSRLKCARCLYEFDIIWNAAAYAQFKAEQYKLKKMGR